MYLSDATVLVRYAGEHGGMGIRAIDMFNALAYTLPTYMLTVKSFTKVAR